MTEVNRALNLEKNDISFRIVDFLSSEGQYSPPVFADRWRSDLADKLAGRLGRVMNFAAL